MSAKGKKPIKVEVISENPSPHESFGPENDTNVSLEHLNDSMAAAPEYLHDVDDTKIPVAEVAPDAFTEVQLGQHVIRVPVGSRFEIYDAKSGQPASLQARRMDVNMREPVAPATSTTETVVDKDTLVRQIAEELRKTPAPAGSKAANLAEAMAAGSTVAGADTGKPVQFYEQEALDHVLNPSQTTHVAIEIQKTRQKAITNIQNADILADALNAGKWPSDIHSSRALFAKIIEIENALYDTYYRLRNASDKSMYGRRRLHNEISKRLTKMEWAKLSQDWFFRKPDRLVSNLWNETDRFIRESGTHVHEFLKNKGKWALALGGLGAAAYFGPSVIQAGSSFVGSLGSLPGQIASSSAWQNTIGRIT